MISLSEKRGLDYMKVKVSLNWEETGEHEARAIGKLVEYLINSENLWDIEILYE